MTPNTSDNIVGETRQRSGNAEGIELIVAFREIDDEYLLELEANSISSRIGRQWGRGMEQTPNVEFLTSAEFPSGGVPLVGEKMEALGASG